MYSVNRTIQLCMGPPGAAESCPLLALRDHAARLCTFEKYNGGMRCPMEGRLDGSTPCRLCLLS